MMMPARLGRPRFFVEGLQGQRSVEGALGQRLPRECCVPQIRVSRAL